MTTGAINYLQSIFVLTLYKSQYSIISTPLLAEIHIACTTDETKRLVKSICEPTPNSCFKTPPVYQDLGAHHDWVVKKAIFNLPSRLKRKFEMHFSVVIC